jgi:hypothetical protein
MDTNIAQAATAIAVQPAEEREELFPVLPGDDVPIGSYGEVMNTIVAIKSVELRQTEFEEQQKEVMMMHKHWFELKRNQCERRIEFLKLRLQGYLEFAQKDKIATPEGTVHFQTTKTIVWPENDEALIVLLQANAEFADRFLNLKETITVNKTELGKALRAGEFIPLPMVTIETGKEVRVKKA